MATAPIQNPAAPSVAPDAMDALLDAVRSRREEFSEGQQISADVVELMKRAGVYRACVAKELGGDEVSPGTFLRMIERISEADGSAGWVASFGVSAAYLASLPVDTLRQMYADGPDVVFSGMIFPPQAARPVGDELEVNGRWSWGSGSTGADYIGVGIKVEGDASTAGLPLVAVMPAHKARIVRNWNVIGLKGTGSHDVAVDKVMVPREWTFVRGSAPSLEGALFRYPAMALAAQVLAVVALGVGRAAIEELMAYAAGRTSITGAPTLANRPNVQADLARAEAMLRSARAFFYETTEDAWEALLRGDELTAKQVTLLRLAASHAARAGSDVATAVYRMSGTTGIFAGHPVAHYMHDAMIVPQHAFLADGTFESAGKVLFGLPSPAGFP
ncbi:Acyl-CoA dehydrogenase, type 2, C-terminal domain (plasmid) [Novosphingobium aromaticivorans DSM 12444]|uniref:Acyl-CoA dehydrogenase, type 2, C-terminal domain n=1 Tax=Novosphingobium aromaticivorans (strain ATCC 700278 / DSM 12444 / CCUG 56034 / CIP 105152 / NBRC 16084 / F199) TaxID=279238 RepID=A4XFF7_NOVAD|nr:acyl-CoA dehydrogenase family protein [Novosphingobium aromaticivorans]ABP64668.1 Acyl-CoA dehydrogenase, type 2, C-terminal domain [Novosphingobium aromaticivorans DSM 12444]SCY80232.1 Acyl-CoA dehydrogenase [Novosphingobium aromaticivorans]